MEEEGFPKSQYQWFKNREEIPDDPKTSAKFLNSSYTLSAEMGTLVSVSAHALAHTRTCSEQQGRDGSGHGGSAPRGGGGYFGETVDGARGLEPRGESAVLVCTFFNSLSRTSAALCSPAPATIPQPRHRQPSVQPLTRGPGADCTRQSSMFRSDPARVLPSFQLTGIFTTPAGTLFLGPSRAMKPTLICRCD